MQGLEEKEGSDAEENETRTIGGKGGFWGLWDRSKRVREKNATMWIMETYKEREEEIITDAIEKIKICREG